MDFPPGCSHPPEESWNDPVPVVLPQHQLTVSSCSWAAGYPAMEILRPPSIPCPLLRHLPYG